MFLSSTTATDILQINIPVIHMIKLRLWVLNREKEISLMLCSRHSITSNQGGKIIYFSLLVVFLSLRFGKFLTVKMSSTCGSVCEAVTTDGYT